jgi:phasin family protein
MSATNEQFSKFAANGFENILRITQISLDSSERFLKQQFEITKQALEDQALAAKELSQLTDPQEALSHINKLLTQTFEKAVKNSRSIYDIVSQTQSELTALSEDSLSHINKSLIGGLESLSQNGPSGSDAAVNVLKSSFAAAAAAVSSLNRAAQQVAEFTDTNVKAATSDAVVKAASETVAKAPSKRGQAQA